MGQVNGSAEASAVPFGRGVHRWVGMGATQGGSVVWHPHYCLPRRAPPGPVRGGLGAWAVLAEVCGTDVRCTPTTARWAPLRRSSGSSAGSGRRIELSAVSEASTSVGLATPIGEDRRWAGAEDRCGGLSVLSYFGPRPEGAPGVIAGCPRPPRCPALRHGRCHVRWSLFRPVAGRPLPAGIIGDGPIPAGQGRFPSQSSAAPLPQRGRGQ